MRLRTATRAEHDRLEGVFDQLDLKTPDGLTTMLQAHLLALSWSVSALPAPDSDEARQLEDLMAAIHADLRLLGQRPRSGRGAPPERGRIHPLGLTYVIAGSRLGARILLREVAASADPRVSQAVCYLRCESGERFWRETQATLEAWSGTPQEELEIIMGARTGFEWFAAALHETLKDTAGNDVHVRVA